MGQVTIKVEVDASKVIAGMKPYERELLEEIEKKNRIKNEVINSIIDKIREYPATGVFSRNNVIDILIAIRDVL